MKFNRAGVDRLLMQIEEALEAEQINGWKISFLESIQEQITSSPTPTLSPKQWNRLQLVLEKCDVDFGDFGA